MGEASEALRKAEEFLSDLEGDARTAPPEALPVIESYAPRLQESLRLFRERRISAVELEAHAFQIRISYVRDLERLLVPERRSETLWYRTDQDVDPTAETVIVRAAE